MDVLAIPLFIDALYLDRSEPVAEPSADFRGLPYHDKAKERDVNSDTPWLGERVASAPFENSNLILQAGVHLHWSLPAGLRHGKMIEGRLTMPTAPNRWLVRRRRSGRTSARAWIVESDYLWPPSDQAPAVNILHRSGDGRPYRFLGRKLDLQEWIQERKRGEVEHEYVDGLTAMAHGNPAFAAYYPDSMSVFGMHDGDLPEDWRSVRYDVIGWYGDGAVEPALSWARDAEAPGVLEESSRRWRVDRAAREPQAIVCHAGIELTRDGAASAPPDGAWKVALGNTVSEALSALLASEVAAELALPASRRAIEEQIEALHIQARLDAGEHDMGLRLRRYRHRKSFAPVAGGERWTLHTDHAAAGHPPRALRHALRELDAIQVRHERQSRRLVQARRQLYGDWCNYMRGVYRPPDGGRGQFLDIDELVAFVETRSLAEVERLIGVVARTGDELARAKSGLETLIARVNHEERRLHAAAHGGEGLPSAEVTAPEQRLPRQYALRLRPGARFWQPATPVVLIATAFEQEGHGPEGHDSDGYLPCAIITWSDGRIDESMMIESARKRLQARLESRSASGVFGIRRLVTGRRRLTPVYLDWGIDLYSAESRAPDEADGYSPDLVTDNYALGTRQPDLQRAGTLWTDDDPDRFSGRCIVGASASSSLRARMEEVLQRRLLGGLRAIREARDPRDPQARGYIDSLVERWVEAARDGSVPEPFAALVAPWADAASEEATERAYVARLADWYRTLADTHAGVSLSGPPSTKAQLDALVAWYAARPLRAASARVDDPLYCTLLAYRRLFVAGERVASDTLRERAFLGQALDGFNDELIQWKPGLTLPVDDPIGLAPYRDFTARVARAVGTANAWSSEPTNRFSPLRSGALRLDRLRLLSRFGQSVDVPCDEAVIVPTPYTSPGRDGVAFLPPRLVQPARVNFRWLEAGEAGARTPICGWLMPERLGNRLLVFSADGEPLGALAADRDADAIEWVRAPALAPLDERRRERGHRALRAIERRYHASAVADQDEARLRDLGELGASVTDPRLARVLLYLWATRSARFLGGFLDTLDDAMRNIDPEGVSGMGATALLIGRPVAVVGAELNLELADEPAVRQDWSAFTRDQHRHHRGSDGFDKVRMPLRLGQFGSRDDGVVGYWIESENGFVDDTFVAQAADDDDPGRPLEVTTGRAALAARINAHDRHDRADALNFTQSVADPPLRTTVLMDPRGQARLTSGVLPTKRIDIPRTLWEPALEAMRVWFPSGPVVSRPGDRRVPVPELPERRWCWLERSRTPTGPPTGLPTGLLWRTLRTRPSVDRHRLRHALSGLALEARATGVPELERLIALGWLVERSPPDARLEIGSREAREPLDDHAVETPLDTLLAHLASALVSPGDDPALESRAEVREGWLMLERDNLTHTP